MSAMYVRQLFEGWLQDPAMQLPYYPTINVEQDPADDMWCTAAFAGSYRETLTFCGDQVLEEGEVELFYQGAPGVGYNDLLTAVEIDLATLMAQTDPAGKLVITERSAPAEASAGSANMNYALSVYIDYEYYD